MVTWPLGIGLYEGEGGICSDCEGPTMSWEAHGLKLAPRVTGAPLEGVTEVQARRDDYDTAEAPEGTSGRFQLSPGVAVVPIRLIVTNPVNTPGIPSGKNESFGAADDNSKFVYVTTYGVDFVSTRYVVAHELGHRLGIDHPIGSDEVCIPKQLMCPYTPQMTDDIPSERCNTVYNKAKMLHNQHWQ